MPMSCWWRKAEVVYLRGSRGAPSVRHEGVGLIWGFPLALQKMIQGCLYSPEGPARGQPGGLLCGVRIFTDVGSGTLQNDSSVAWHGLEDSSKLGFQE